MLQSAQLRFINEDTLLVEFGDRLDDAVFQRVLNLNVALSRAPIAANIETLPTYRSLMIRFDAFVLSQHDLLAELSVLDLQHTSITPGRWRVPVCFEGPCAEDLMEVAGRLGFSPQEVIAMVISSPLKLYMYGFAPGFAYLGGLNNELMIPRRESPRAPMPQGALMIAGGLASITSVSMPTGWYVLGQTPVTMFSVGRAPMVPFSIGDELQLTEIGLDEFESLKVSANLDMIQAIERNSICNSY